MSNYAIGATRGVNKRSLAIRFFIVSTKYYTECVKSLETVIKLIGTDKQ